MENTEKIIVCNTFSDKYEEVEVSKEVAIAYKRTGWCIEKRDQKFFDNEIQFSQLIGGKDGAYENFREFISGSDELQENVEKEELVESLYMALKTLNEKELHIIIFLFFEGLTETECAERIGVAQQVLNRKKHKIFKKIKKFLKRGCRNANFVPYTSEKK